jgi:CubicO group peptidase (beta-lactamase class C family)
VFAIATIAVTRTVSIAQDPTARVDRLFAAWNRSGSPGCAVGVVKDGALVYSHGYGMADLEHSVRITPASVFYIGSLSKQFTAMAIALLAQQGKLGLDDDIRTYLPELPEYPAPITIRQLLHHTSGLTEYIAVIQRVTGRPAEPTTDRDVLEIMKGERSVSARPGERFEYSNTGYTFLGLIAERAAAVPLDAFAESQIFAPLGMRSTRFYDDTRALVRNRAYAYEPVAGGGFRFAPPVPARLGAGGVFTTVEDLVRWDRNFYDAKVGGQVLIRQMTTPGTLSNGTPIEYGFGLELHAYREFRAVEHGGDFVGYHAYLSRFPDQRLSVIVLCNGSDISPAPLAHGVADVYLGY